MTIQHNDLIPDNQTTALTHEPISVCGPQDANNPVVEPRFGNPFGNDLNPATQFNNRGKPTLARSGLFLPPQLSNGDGGPDILLVRAGETAPPGNPGNQFPANANIVGEPDGKLHSPLTIAFGRF